MIINSTVDQNEYYLCRKLRKLVLRSLNDKDSNELIAIHKIYGTHRQTHDN